MIKLGRQVNRILVVILILISMTQFNAIDLIILNLGLVIFNESTAWILRNERRKITKYQDLLTLNHRNKSDLVIKMKQ